MFNHLFHLILLAAKTVGDAKRFFIFVFLDEEDLRCEQDQSVLSSLTEIPLPPAGIIAWVTCQIKPISFDDQRRKKQNKDLEFRDQSHGRSSVPLPI